jgi:hypothetical protein
MPAPSVLFRSPRPDAIALGGLFLLCVTTILVGGLFHPNTVAGAIARIVFAL